MISERRQIMLSILPLIVYSKHLFLNGISPPPHTHTHFICIILLRLNFHSGSHAIIKYNILQMCLTDEFKYYLWLLDRSEWCILPPSALPSPSIRPSFYLAGKLASKWQGWQTSHVGGLASWWRGAKLPGGVSHHHTSYRSNEGDCRLGIPSPVSGIGRQISSASRAYHKWYVDKCRYFTFNWH